MCGAVKQALRQKITKHTIVILLSCGNATVKGAGFTFLGFMTNLELIKISLIWIWKHRK
jgi:hypothetical protein